MPDFRLSFLGYLAAVRYTLNHALYDPRTDPNSAAFISLEAAQRMAKLAWSEFRPQLDFTNPKSRRLIANHIRIGRYCARNAIRALLTPRLDPKLDPLN